MGPWFVRDEARPFMPGFSEAILRHQVASGRVKADTIVRGPTTHQFWMRADQTPGLSRLLGKCHACGGNVTAQDESCGTCHADLSLPHDIDRLGLSYTEPGQRQQVQAEIDALRSGSPPPKPAPPPKQPPAQTHVDPDLLEPVAPKQPQAEQAHEAHPPAGHDSPLGDFAEDLWHGDGPAPARRRKKRGGPDPIVLTLAVLLLCVVGVGLLVIITSSGADDSETDDPLAQQKTGADKPELPPRSEGEVAAIAQRALAALGELRDAGVPEPFTAELDRADQLRDQAERYEEAGDNATAYDRYEQIQEMLIDTEARIAQWQRDQAIREEVNELLDEVVALQSRAKTAGAETWSAGWSKGERDLGAARGFIEAGQYTEAQAKLRDARSSYETAIDTTMQAIAASDAQKTLARAMENGPSQQTLLEHAAALVGRLDDTRQQAARKFEDGQYAESESAYREALSAYEAALGKVELAKFRKVYAYQAGYAAAGALIGITVGDGLTGQSLQTLRSAFDKLALPNNPAGTLSAGDDPDYADAAQTLVTDARKAIADTHGETARASYHAGFQVRIIEQTLETTSFTSDQQKRIHQCLAVFQDQAAAAGWDVVKLRDAVEAVRNANRLAKVGESPEKVREAFDVMVKPMQGRATAARLMDPTLSPSAPDDPELFPGLGSSRP
jgi:tetratricopeptide (TPR) repeat protein